MTIKFIGLVLFTLFSVFSSVGQETKIITGAEQPEKYIPLIQNKKVGLVVNHTSMVNDVHLVDFLLT